MSEDLWNGRPRSKWRFSKFYLNRLFNGQVHLVTPGRDFPSECADEDVSKRLRNAAWWRGTTVRITPIFGGLLVQSAGGEPGVEDSPLALALLENARLKDEIKELKEELWQLKSPQ